MRWIMANGSEETILRRAPLGSGIARGRATEAMRIMLLRES
jgi:hypothetical protein